MFKLLIWLLLAAVAHCGLPHDTCKGLTCQRKPHIMFLGLDYSGKQVQVDVGKCVANSTASGQILGFPLPPLPQLTSCECLPSELTHLTPLTRSGPQAVQSVSECNAPSMQGACQRHTSRQHFHSHTSYHTVLELGSCAGRCHDSEQACTAISKVSLAVEGPNGYSIADNITECGCAPINCYRRDYYQLILVQEAVEVGENTTSFRTVEKAINVGECVGMCKGIFLPGECIPSPEQCKIYKGPTQATCVPLTTDSETYLDAAGQEQQITSTLTCACGRP